MIGLHRDLENNSAIETCIPQPHRTKNELERHMKSLGLALTIFSLTGALAALDLSGAARTQLTDSDVAQTTQAVHAFRAATSTVTTADQEEAAADDEADGELITTFLVTPRSLAPVNGSLAPKLRYD